MNQDERSFRVTDFFLVFLIGAVAASVAKGALVGLVPALLEGTIGRLATSLWLQDGFFLLGIAMVLAMRKKSWRDLGVCRPQGRFAIAKAIILGFALFLGMSVVGSLINRLAPNGLKAQNVEAYMNAGDSLTVVLFVLLTMGVFAPIVEEFLYRGLLYQSLAPSLSPAGAMVFTSLLFGATHLDIQRAIPIALGGLVLNLLVYRQKSIWGSVISHGVWNTTMIIVYYLSA